MSSGVSTAVVLEPISLAAGEVGDSDGVGVDGVGDAVETVERALSNCSALIGARCCSLPLRCGGGGLVSGGKSSV